MYVCICTNTDIYIYTEGIYIYNQSIHIKITTAKYAIPRYFKWLLMIHISTWRLELPHHRRSSCRSWFPLVSDEKGCCSKPTPEKPTLSVQCIDIWYIYSIIYSIPPPQRKGYIKRNLSHFRICPQKSRGYHLSLITIYLRNIYLSSICISPTQPTRWSPCHVRARSFDDSTDLHQTPYVVLQMSYFTTPTCRKSYIKRLMPYKSYAIFHTRN